MNFEEKKREKAAEAIKWRNGKKFHRRCIRSEVDSVADVDTDTDVALEMKQISLARNFKGKSKKVPKELYRPTSECGLSLVQTTAVLLQPETRAVHYSD